MTTRYRLSVAAALAATTLFAASAQAHHSFAAMFDANKPVRLTGKLTKVEWVNPHSHFVLAVKGKDGQVQEWSVEGAGPGTLSRRGFSKGSVKVGDVLTVDGYLARSGGRIIDGQRVTLPDGRIFQTGSTGAGAAPGAPPDPSGRTPPAASPQAGGN